MSLLLPLAVLAIPILDTSFVVAKRLKHRLPVYESDRFHLHHRFLNIGYSQRRAVLTIYGWCATLAAAALATRFIQPHPHGDWRPWAIAVDAAIGLAALAASIYIVYLLEIVKLANPIIRRREEAARQRAAADAQSGAARLISYSSLSPSPPTWTKPHFSSTRTDRAFAGSTSATIFSRPSSSKPWRTHARAASVA